MIFYESKKGDNRMKKITSFVLTVALLISVCSFGGLTTMAEAAVGGHLTYTVSNSEATVTKCDTAASGVVTIPAVLGGCPVTSIDKYAFSECNKITGMIIPEGVKSIGFGAFWDCNQLDFIDIPETVTFIDAYAFKNCISLKSIKLPKGITVISEMIFSGCSSLESIIIPYGVTYIQYGAFSECRNLSGVVLPKTVTKIGNGGFVRCNKLTDVVYGGTEADIELIDIGTANITLTGAIWHYVIPGDITGDKEVDVLDLVYLQRYLAKWQGYDELLLLEMGDTTMDGVVNNFDMLDLLNKLAGNKKST